MSDLHLHHLARLAGLAVDWIDANGKAQKVSDPDLRAILAALGHPAEDADSVAHSIKALEQAEDAQHLPPLLTVDLGEALPLAHWFDAGNLCHAVLEDGSEQALRGCPSRPARWPADRLSPPEHQRPGLHPRRGAAALLHPR